MKRFIIGINTGGTFTDGVLLDYSSRKVVSSAKSLTTRHDLKVGVNKVLKKLDIQPDYDIKLVGISSTLATNTVAEKKGKKTGLLLIGYDRSLIEKFSLSDKLPADVVGYVTGGHNAQGAEAAPVDKKGIVRWVKKHAGSVDAVAISSYFSPLNPEHEETAFEIVKKHSSLPVVMAHQLSTRLDSIKRAATASINASLVAVMQDFIESVCQSMDDRGIDAPLMIVRGDGTLMPSEEAARKPVETVMSGPAASAIGGRFLSGCNSGLVVDMGSTTTDMALVQNSRVTVTTDGARVGDCETAVKAARIRTISLGCDSRIHPAENGEPALGPERVRSLSHLAATYDHVLQELQELKDSGKQQKNINDIEYWRLHEPVDEETLASLSDQQKKVLELIESPRRLSDLIRDAGVYHVGHLGMDELLRHGIIECAGLTPTDLLHADRSLDLWDREAANLAVDHYCNIHDKSPKVLIEEVFHKITDILVEEIIIFLACQDSASSDMPHAIDGAWGKWMLEQILHSSNHFISIDADSRYPVIGAGAPAEYFLKRAARLMNAKFLLPDYFEVANAVGAVAGSIAVTMETMVYTRDHQNQYVYIAKYNGRQEEFRDYDECCDFAEETARRLAREGAEQAGATDCYVELENKKEGSLLRFIASAVGTPALSRKPVKKRKQDLETDR